MEGLLDLIHSGKSPSECSQIASDAFAVNGTDLPQIETRIAAAATYRVEYIVNKLTESFPDNELLRLLTLVKMAHRDISRYSWAFPNTILNSALTIPALAAQTYLLLLNPHIQNIQFLAKESPDIDMLNLYQQCRILYQLCEEIHVPKPQILDIGDVFIDFLNNWLSRTDTKWNAWVQNAFELDEKNGFAPIQPPTNMYSDSVLQVFKFFQAALDFIDHFKFKNQDVKDRVSAKFIVTMSKTLQAYCCLLSAEFETLDNKNSDQVHHFSVHQCIKMNNALAADYFLNDILQKLELSETLDSFIPMIKASSFEVKIIRARNISPKNWSSSDPFVVLKMKDILGASRVVQNTIHPVWNQTTIVKLSEDGDQSLELIVYHDNPYGDEIECGRTVIFLDSFEWNDCLSHDLELFLVPTGSLHIRLRKMGNPGHSDWYKGRVREVITFTIEDMTRSVTCQIVRAFGFLLKQLMASSMSTNFFGLLQLGSASTLTLLDIEKKMKHILDYVDSQLAVFYSCLDRNQEVYAELFPNQTMTEHVPFIVGLLWSGLVKYLAETAETLDPEKLKDKTRRTSSAFVLDAVLEYLKALFYSDETGLSLAVLESPSYLLLRTRLESLQT